MLFLISFGVRDYPLPYVQCPPRQSHVVIDLHVTASLFVYPCQDQDQDRPCSRPSASTFAMVQSNGTPPAPQDGCSDILKHPFQELKEKLHDVHLHDAKVHLIHQKYISLDPSPKLLHCAPLTLRV